MSAQALGDDVTRHLSGHPVLARRPSMLYRTRRFAGRHKWGIAAMATIIVLLAAYGVTVTLQRARIARALTEATIGAQKAERVSDSMLGLFEASAGGTAFGDTLTARALLDRGLARAAELTGQPEVRAQMLDVVGQIHTQLGDYEKARRVFEDALAIRQRVLGSDTRRRRRQPREPRRGTFSQRPIRRRARAVPSLAGHSSPSPWYDARGHARELCICSPTSSTRRLTSTCLHHTSRSG